MDNSILENPSEANQNEPDVIYEHLRKREIMENFFKNKLKHFTPKE